MQMRLRSAFPRSKRSRWARTGSPWPTTNSRSEFSDIFQNCCPRQMFRTTQPGNVYPKTVPTHDVDPEQAARKPIAPGRGQAALVVGVGTECEEGNNSPLASHVTVPKGPQRQGSPQLASRHAQYRAVPRRDAGAEDDAPVLEPSELAADRGSASIRQHVTSASTALATMPRSAPVEQQRVPEVQAGPGAGTAVRQAATCDQ